MDIKILSWNIWIDGHLEEIKNLLQQMEADIIGLQEVKDDDPSLDVINYLTEQGYQHIFAPIRKTWGDKVYNDGPAVFSKYPILMSQTYLLSKENARGAARADIQVGEKVLHVFSTHLLHTHQKYSEIQTEQVESLINLLPPDNTIVMGDFNATPDSNAIKRMRDELIDTDPSSAPTWSVYPEGCSECKPQKIDTRLDYIFVSPDIKTMSPKVESSKGSDHLPISVTISI
jgi:endonuclease/exonuclease/phosphatase family metal-dependent hydrolase